MTLTIHENWAPGIVGDIAALHARVYAASHGFGRAFETTVATGLGEMLGYLDPARDFFRAVESEGRFRGSIALDASAADGTARLRYFILDDALRGQGIGKGWMEALMGHARATRLTYIHLWTLTGLDAATALYVRAGFVLEEERDATPLFGAPGTARRFGVTLTPPR